MHIYMQIFTCVYTNTMHCSTHINALLMRLFSHNYEMTKSYGIDKFYYNSLYIKPYGEIKYI